MHKSYTGMHTFSQDLHVLADNFISHRALFLLFYTHIYLIRLRIALLVYAVYTHATINCIVIGVFGATADTSS